MIKFSKLHPNAVTPTRAKHGDAGFDLTAVEYKYVSDAPVPYHEYNIGITFEIPLGWVGIIVPRSSVSNKDLMLCNSVGVIDAGYRGVITCRFKGNAEHIYNVGDRVAQLLVVECFQGVLKEVEYSELSKSERNTGGFGHSGA